MKVFLLLSLALSMGVATQVQANDAYDRAAAIYEGAKLPDANDFNSGIVYLGKCTHKNLGTTRTSSALYIHTEEEPILGTLFSIMPLFELGDKDQDYETLKKIALAKIYSPELATLVGYAEKEKAWTEDYRPNGRRDGVFKTVLFREFKMADGTPALVIKTWKYRDQDPIYCYYYQRLGYTGGEPVVMPPSPQ